MSKKTVLLSDVIRHPQKNGSGHAKPAKRILSSLQLKNLRIQQGIWQRKSRVVIALEGFDAAGKGGCIRRLTEGLDPRGMAVHPIGPPSTREQGTHWLYRFWTRLPPPGSIAIFDRTWCGRVLVERVDELIPKSAWKRGYSEIREFERMLVDDGVDLVKIFLAVSKDEQLKRFEERLHDPYKQWKLTMDDIRARAKWKDYVLAADELLQETDTKLCPWHVISSDDKHAARIEVLKVVTKALVHHGEWMEARKGLAKSEKEIAKALSHLR